MITNGGSSTGTNIVIQNMQRQMLIDNQNIHATEINNKSKRLDNIDKTILGSCTFLFVVLFIVMIYSFIQDITK